MKAIIQTIYNQEYESLTNQKLNHYKKIYVFYDSNMINGDSVYLRVKTKYAKLFQVELIIIDLNERTSLENHFLLNQIIKNKDFLFFELPLSKDILKENYFSYLNIDNDIDGLHAPDLIDKKFNMIKYHPATVLAVLEILKNIQGYQNKKIAIIGRSKYLGNYLYKYLIFKKNNVTQFHSQSVDVNKQLRNYEIVISCINNALIYSTDDLANNSYLIDVTTEIVNNKVVGSFIINENNIKTKNIKYTPVPGGVGKLTTLFLFKNYYK